MPHEHISGGHRAAEVSEILVIFMLPDGSVIRQNRSTVPQP